MKPAFQLNKTSWRSQIAHTVIWILAFFGSLLLGCEPATPTPTAETYTLTVINGTGSGRYQAGSTVHVWADPYPQGWAFDTWKGDIQPLPDIRSMHATMTMPTRSIQIETTYKPIPVWSASYTKISDRDVYYYFPPSGYKGLILFFHGSGGDAREWSDLGAERRNFFDEAIADGYAILSFDSADRLTKQWNLNLPPDFNPDLEALKTILATFREDGQLSAEIPVYAVGMSRGGRFATLVGYALHMKASALWVSVGHEDVMTMTEIPTIWCLADHDPIIDRDQALVYYKQLQSKGVNAIYYVHSQTPLYPLYFVNIEGIDKAASEQLFSDLKSQGYLDQNNFLIDNPRLSGWERHVGLDYSEGSRLDIQDRLFVAYAEHAFYSDCDHRVLDFFNSQP